MNFTPRPLPKHRRTRLIAWTLAMLMWMASVLFNGAALTSRHERQRGPRMSFVGLMRMVKLLIIARASDFAASRWRKRYPRAFRGRCIIPTGAVRALIGARVQRQLKRETVADRILVMIDAIRNIDRYAALVAKRFKHGLTRRWLAVFALPPAPDAPVIALTAPDMSFADSS